jgi:GAF domain-containing protein
MHPPARPAPPDGAPPDLQARYDEVLEQIFAVVDGEPSAVARCATAACLLAEAFRPRFSWTGFYLADPARPGELVVGPYQGPLGCLRIPPGKGVCGAAFATGQTQLVPDVHAFPGHIACDAAARSELVVPLPGPDGRPFGVLDVDSHAPEAFGPVDAAALERLCAGLLQGAAS